MLLRSDSQKDTEEIGRLIGENLFPGAFIALNGELGSGKTAFVQGLGRGLGIEKGINSPTFIIMHEHEGRLKLYHMDMYRMHESDAEMDPWLQEYIEGDGVAAVEWPLEDILPVERLDICIEYDEGDRRILDINAYGKAYEDILEKIRR